MNGSVPTTGFPLRSFLFLLAACLSPAAAARCQATEDADDEPYRVNLAGHGEEARYLLLVQGSEVGTIDWTRRDSGEIENLFRMSVGGQTAETRMSVRVDEGGRWTGIETAAPHGRTTATRDGLLVLQDLLGQESSLHLEPETLLFDNYAPGLLSELVLRLEADDRRPRKFSLFGVGAPLFNSALEFKDARVRSIEGRDVECRRYTLHLPGLDSTLWADPSARILLWDIPTQKAAYVREGFEELTRPEQVDPLLSQPAHAVRLESNVMVPMRDGVRLATDLYLPETEEKVPLVLFRTPYGKAMAEVDGKYWARRGYACAIQDCRGRFESEGIWTPFLREAEDGYDTIEWLAGHPFCTGKVGMKGGSYGGWVQWWAASRKPPHLTTIIPCVAPPDPLFNVPYDHGVFFLLGAMWWSVVLEKEATADLSQRVLRDLNAEDFSHKLSRLPVVELDRAFLGRENRYFREWIRHHDQAAYWDPALFQHRLEEVDIPVFHQSGWFDGDGIGSKLNYLAMRSHGHAHQKLVLGPWGHTDTSTRASRGRDFGAGATPDLQREYLRWFDHWLKGIENGLEREPLVRMFTMGSNRWRTGDTYPLEGTEFRKLYLASNGSANTGKGDGALTWSAGESPAPSDGYEYDPGDPTPDPAFFPTSGEEGRADGAGLDASHREINAYHLEVTSRRQDILVYRTPPLKEPLTVCGPLSAVLYASTTARDTDWFLTLSEETAGAEIFVLATGKIRARYRNSPLAPEEIEPGEVVEYHLDCWHTGITFPKGSRVRVEVSSAQFPTFSRNLNTGGHSELETEFVTARQTIHHTQERPSHILLPVLPE